MADDSPIRPDQGVAGDSQTIFKGMKAALQILKRLLGHLAGIPRKQLRILILLLLGKDNGRCQPH